MIFPYITRRIRRRPLAAALLFLLNFVTALLLCVLHVSITRMYEQIDAVYASLQVTCQVSSITGTQTDNLNLPEWVVRLFLGKSNIPGNSDISYRDDEESWLFRTYIKDVKVKTSIKGQCSGTAVSLIGINSILADQSLREGYGDNISWLVGYDETVLSEDNSYCLIPVSLSCLLSESGTVRISFTSGDQIITRELLAVGTHTGSKSSIYCPWNIAAQIDQELNGTVHADSVSAVINDNKKISEFLDEAAYNYFVEPNARGSLTPWEESPVYDYFPYALIIDDDVLEETVFGMNNNLSVFILCTAAITILSLILGFVAGHLIVRHRIQSLALQRVLGQSNRRIFFENWLELTVAAAAGTITGTAVFVPVGSANFSRSAILIALAFCILGITSAIIAILHTDLIQSIREET